MNKADTTHLIQKQKAFFATGKTHSLAFRMHALATVSYTHLTLPTKA